MSDFFIDDWDFVGDNEDEVLECGLKPLRYVKVVSNA